MGADPPSLPPRLAAAAAALAAKRAAMTPPAGAKPAGPTAPKIPLKPSIAKPPAAPVTADRLPGEAEKLLREAATVCESLERGQSETPLGDQLRELTAEAARPQVSITLAATSAAAAAAGLRWLCGAEPEPPGAETLAACGAFEVVWTEASGGGSPWAVLQEASRAGGDEGCLPLVRLAARPGFEGVRLLAVADIEAVANRPVLFQRLLTQGQVLVLAVGEGDGPAAPAEAALRDVIAAHGVVMPLRAGEAEAAGELCKSLTQGRTEPCLPAVTVGGEGGQPLSEALAQASSPLRMALATLRVAKRLERILGLAEERQGQALRQTQAKQAEIEGRAKALEAKAKRADPRGEMERFKTEIEERLQTISGNLEDRNRRQIQRRGKLSVWTKELIDGLTIEDLAQTKSTRKIRKTLESATLESIMHEIEEENHRQLTRDVETVSAELQSLAEDLSKSLSAMCGTQVRLAVSLPEESPIWHLLRGDFRFQTGAQLEMARVVNFTSFLMGSRKMLIPVMMTASILGFNLRNLLQAEMLISVPLLLGSAVFAVLELYRAELDKQETDFERIKETLNSEAARINADVISEKNKRLGAHLARVKKELLGEIDRRVREALEEQAAAAERSREEVRARAKPLEAVVKELMGAGASLGKLLESCRELQRQCRSALEQAARAPAVAAP